MEIAFWGATQTVTGSMHLVTLENGRRLLLDCGLYQGRRAKANLLNSRFPFDASSVDAVLLSHAHIDHSGNLPGLWKAGFRGKIWATPATDSLCRPMLLDSAFIQAKDVQFVNKRREKKGLPLVEPLYSTQDAEAVLDRFSSVGYGSKFTPLGGVEVEYRDAGHILGSASMVLTVGEGKAVKRLGFTGDIGRAHLPIIRDPQPMENCDFLITESTYGGKRHDPVELSKDKLARIIARTCARGGKVLIPAFAVGRTQEIVHTLDQLWKEDRLPRVPVFVDSPLAINVTRVFRSHPECYDDELREYLATDEDAFGFGQLRYVRKTEESKALNSLRGPMVIIAASGMCEGGRILHHLRSNIGDPRTTILMVSYCADHTLGKRLIDEEREVRIYGETFTRRAEVVVMNSYSAHADQDGLMSFIGDLDRLKLKRIFLVHGAPARQEALKESLTEAGYRSVSIPNRGFKARL